MRRRLTTIAAVVLALVSAVAVGTQLPAEGRPPPAGAQPVTIELEASHLAGSPPSVTGQWSVPSGMRLVIESVARQQHVPSGLQLLNLLAVTPTSEPPSLANMDPYWLNTSVGNPVYTITGSGSSECPSDLQVALTGDTTMMKVVVQDGQQVGINTMVFGATSPGGENCPATVGYHVTGYLEPLSA